MKKQILILVMAIFAIGFSTTAFAQFLPRPIECIDLEDPLHPVAGNEYTYSVEIPNPDGVNSFRWFVTQDQNFIDAGVLTTAYAAQGGAILFSAEAHYTQLTAGANSIELVWQSWVYDPNAPVFVVVEVQNDGVGGNGCATMNLKAYKIQPLHAFTLDIANVTFDGTDYTTLGDDYGLNINHCVSPIADATYDFDEDRVTYDFGTNTLYYAVVAANWATAWRLRVDFVGLQTGQTVDIYWGTTPGATTNTIIVGAAADGNWDATNLITSATPVGADGQIIYITAVIHHYNFELITLVPYTLSVDGQLSDGTNLIADMYDLHYLDGAAQCGLPDGFDNDKGYQTLMPRPEVQPTLGAPDFLPIAP
jgi:hypothetical protein